MLFGEAFQVLAWVACPAERILPLCGWSPHGFYTMVNDPIRPSV
jgi:hypothetical protein